MGPGSADRWGRKPESLGVCVCVCVSTHRQELGRVSYNHLLGQPQPGDATLDPSLRAPLGLPSRVTRLCMA